MNAAHRWECFVGRMEWRTAGGLRGKPMENVDLGLRAACDGVWETHAVA
jgi:hypothetical protein